MSAEEWSAAVEAGLESMDDHHALLSNQADFLPTSSQSPENSPQPSPDSQQKDLGAAVSSQSQAQYHTLQTSKVAVSQPSKLQQIQILGSQQDQQVSQSSDLARSQSPVFRGSPRSTISSSQEGTIHKSNQSGPVLSSGRAALYTSQNVLKVQLPPQHQQQGPAQGTAHNIGSQPQLNPHHIIQPRQVSPQRPQSKMNSPNSPSKQKGVQMVQPNSNVGIRSALQTCPTGSAMQTFSSGAHQQLHGKQHLNQPVPQHSQRMQAGQHQLSPRTNSTSGSPQNMGQGPRMGAPPLIHQKQQQNQHQQQQIVRHHILLDSEGHNNRPSLPHHIPKQNANFPHHNPNSSAMATSRAQTHMSQTENNPSLASGSNDNSHGMGFMPEDDMYDEEYEGPMEGTYDPEYEEEEEDYDEDMEEGHFDYDGPPFYYGSDASDDLSEEESNLFEELSNLPESHPRYEVIVNRLREKGVDRDEIDEIINPQRPAYRQVYGREPYDEHEDEEDEEMEDDEGTVSSSFYSEAERFRQFSISQTGTGMQQNTVSQSHSLLQNQNQTLLSSTQIVKAPSALQTGQLQQNVSQSGQTQPHKLNQLQSAQSQQQCLSQPSPQVNAPRASIAHPQQQRPLSRPNFPSSSHVPQRPNSQHLQQQQRPKTLANIYQHRKVFQSPAQTYSSTIPSETSDCQQYGPKPPISAKSLPNSTVGLQAQEINPPRQVGPNRLPTPSQSVVRSPGQLYQSRAPIPSTAPGGQNPRGQVPLHQMAVGQGAQTQVLQQGTAVQPPMVRGVNPRAQRMLRPGAPSLNVGPRSFGFPAQGNLRPRTMTAPNARTNRPLGQLRAPALPNRASQSRLDVQHMQEMLDKQIMAKKGASAVSSQNPAIGPLSQGTEDQSHFPTPPIPSQNTPQPRQFLPPRRPILSGPPIGRHPCLPPKHAETPQGMHPMAPRLNTPVRPRAPVPISQTMTSPPQQSPSAPQVRISLQAGTSGQAVIQGKNVIPQQASLATADSSKSVQEHQKSFPAGLQTGVSKPPSFNPETVAESKINLLSSRSGKLEINKTYKIRSPIDQSIVVAVWNGEKFVSAGQDIVKGSAVATANVGGTPAQNFDRSQDASNSIPKPKANSAPGGSSAFQDQFLQSLQTCTKQQESSSEPDTNTGSTENQPTDQSEKLESAQVPQSTSQATYIKPLFQGPKQQKKSDEDDEDEDDDSIFKKPFSENEDVFRVCNNCGYTSKNFKRCDGCKKLFQGEMKIHCTKKTSAKVDTPSPEPSSSGSSTKKQDMKPSDRFREVMSKASFYGNKNASRGSHERGVAASRRGLGRTKGGGWKGKSGLQTEEEGEDHFSSDEEADSKRGIKRRPGRPKNTTSAPKKRSKKTDEPVTVTISSDEDEPSSTSNMFPGFSPSPARSAGSESPIFTTTHMSPVNAFGRFRRVRMEDEEGHSKLQKKLQLTQNKQSSMVHQEEELDEDEYEDGDEPAVYQIDIRSVRIGSMRTQPQQPMFISLNGVCFKCRSERTDEEFECEILCSEVEHVKFYAGQPQPVLFLFLSQESGDKIRNICHMEPGDEEYFDPCCTDMKQKMVVIIIESCSEPFEMLRENLTLWADMNHQEDSEYLEELSEEMTNDLLIQSAPPVLAIDGDGGLLKFKKRYIYEGDEPHVQQYPRMPASPPEGMDNEEPDSTSSSPPDIRNHFFGPPIRLLLYPPPPARGISITTEDLMCLAEGEFLNDVVIDFYLQYLYKEKLSEANQKRTHIFSSFFYKRLTQRDRHSEKTEEDAKKSLPERRHARVKKWTKHVDLFSKDFIIVPINEHSHWYLAVICFPGLANPEVVPYIPNAAHTSDVDEASNDGGGSETASSSKDEGNRSQETQMKHTVLGRQLSGDECNNTEDGKLVGQKQPCILMFDSLAGPSRNPNVKMLREYLQCEWNAKKPEERQIAKIVRGSTPKVPQQSNFSDCGVFLLQYVESFFEDPIADFQIPMKGLQNWFPEEVVLHKRRAIHELIMNLHQVYMEDRGDPRILDIPFESTPRRPLPPTHMDIPNPNNHEHFLGKLDDEAGVGGALGKDDENSNSSAAWELAKAVPSPPFPVALRQNAMFEREESNQSNSEIQNEEEKDEEAKDEDEEEEEDVNLASLTQERCLEDSDNVDNMLGKDGDSQTELTDEKVDNSEGTHTEEGTEGENKPMAEQPEAEIEDGSLEGMLKGPSQF
ncbi:sentrin-specific protease 7 [Elysia marginata]|uniref:Sentrin-specific protease 7 n=1 Tax=Elysia marginata TaxID=1093978 RepID=A0AAV4FTC5_9GAST|nr:sentrin-specific protease 7 [Elysia marginata]